VASLVQVISFGLLP